MRRPAAGLVAAIVLVVGCSDDEPADRKEPTTSTAQPTSSTSAPPQVFADEVAELAAEDLGPSWRPGCPVAPSELRVVHTPHWGFDGQVHQGHIVVAAAVADDALDVLRELYDARYPIERMEPVSVYGGDDIASVLANNTSGFNCRFVAGTSRWSEHAYGRAIDLNPRVNPYITAGGTVIPQESAPYVDRTLGDPGMIRDGDAAVVAFERRGWTWGGRWRTAKDYQHFSTTGR